MIEPERTNERFVGHKDFGPVWLWEEIKGGQPVTQVQSLMITLCPRCHYPYCQTIPVQLWAAELINCIGRPRCPQCGWVKGLDED